jgi:Protein of unknown function (DUF3891)
MMCQTAPEGEAHFISTMDDHMNLCGQMVRAFGNDRFQRPAPYDEIVYVVENHDRGWKHYDLHPGLDPDTRLPYLMSQTPTPDALVTNKGSPDFNEARHPYCGLLSSMHTCGIYNGRYGLSQFKVPPRKPPPPGDVALKAGINAMIEAETDRQNRLKAALKGDPRTAAWMDDKRLFQNFKQLQFFDTLSLYFHLRGAADRTTEVFIHVPVSAEEDASVTARKLSDFEYSLDPFPFAGDCLKITCGGWYFHRYPEDADPALLGDALRAAPRASQTFTLIAA